MEVKATLKTYRQSPRKVRLLAGEVVGKSIDEAKAVLNNAPKRVAPALLKLINSAEANARDRNLDSGDLRVYRLNVDEGPTLFRMRPRAFGRAFVIRKRTSHITVVLSSDSNENKVEKKEEVKKEKTEMKKEVKNEKTKRFKKDKKEVKTKIKKKTVKSS